jgi:copper transport protein
MTRRNLLLTALTTAIMLSGLPASQPAAAHAKLVRADPPPRSVVKVAPKVVRVWFNDELDPILSWIIVWGAAGRRVDDGKGGVDLNDLSRKSMVVRLRHLVPGTYTVRWQAVSADDLAGVSGAFQFTVRR